MNKAELNNLVSNLISNQRDDELLRLIPLISKNKELSRHTINGLLQYISRSDNVPLIRTVLALHNRDDDLDYLVLSGPGKTLYDILFNHYCNRMAGVLDRAVQRNEVMGINNLTNPAYGKPLIGCVEDDAIIDNIKYTFDNDKRTSSHLLFMSLSKTQDNLLKLASKMGVLDTVRNFCRYMDSTQLWTLIDSMPIDPPKYSFSATSIRNLKVKILMVKLDEKRDYNAMDCIYAKLNLEVNVMFYTMMTTRYPRDKIIKFLDNIDRSKIHPDVVNRVLELLYSDEDVDDFNIIVKYFKALLSSDVVSNLFIDVTKIDEPFHLKDNVKLVARILQEYGKSSILDDYYIQALPDKDVNMINVMANFYAKYLPIDKLDAIADKLILMPGYIEYVMKWANNLSPRLLNEAFDYYVSRGEYEYVYRLVYNAYASIDESSIYRLLFKIIREKSMDASVLLDLIFERGLILDRGVINNALIASDPYYHDTLVRYKRKLDLLDKLESQCSNNLDPISQEEFRTLSIDDLEDIININGHCYAVETLNSYITDRHNRGVRIVDPLNPAYRLTDDDLEGVYTIMKRRNPDYIPPTYSKHEYPGFSFSYGLEGDFYHLYIETDEPIFDLGYVPANIEVADTGSTDLTSAVLIHNLETLWTMGRILNFDGTNYTCCQIPLRQSKEYWMAENGTIDLDKFVSFARIVEDRL